VITRRVQDVFDPYRPELHYMRGPGPRWLEKHGITAATGIVEESAQDEEPANPGIGNRPGGRSTVFHELFQGRPGDGSARR
jgi:hypothetical protein